MDLPFEIDPSVVDIEYIASKYQNKVQFDGKGQLEDAGDGRTVSSYLLRRHPYSDETIVELALLSDYHQCSNDQFVLAIIGMSAVLPIIEDDEMCRELVRQFV